MDKVNTDLDKFVFNHNNENLVVGKNKYSCAISPTLPTIHIPYGIAPYLMWTQTHTSLCSKLNKFLGSWFGEIWEVGGANFRSASVIEK